MQALGGAEMAEEPEELTDFAPRTEGTAAEERLSSKASRASGSSASSGSRLKGLRSLGSGLGASLGGGGGGGGAGLGASLGNRLSEAKKLVGDAASRTQQVSAAAAASVASAASAASAAVSARDGGALQSGAAKVTGGIRSAAAQAAAHAGDLPRMGSLVGGGGGPGSAAGEASAELALGLAGATFELFAGASPACDLSERKEDYARLLDGVVCARHVPDLIDKLTEFWYMVRLDALADWSHPKQLQWLRVACAAQRGDVQKAPAALAKAACGLLLELGASCRQTAPWWSATESEAWAQSLRFLAQAADETPPPAGWGFPAMAIVQREAATSGAAAEPGTSGPVVQSFSLARRDEKGALRVKAAEVAAALAAGSARAFAPRAQALMDRGSQEGARELASSPEALAALGASPEKCEAEAGQLLTQKTRPVRLLNQASSPLKVCLFHEADFVMAVPVGGPGGPCVVTLDPTRRAALRPPGSGARFKMKVLTPGFIDKPLYTGTVARGQSVQLRSHDCSAE